MLAETDGLMPSGQAKYVQQLVAVLALPPEDGDMENVVYEEEHWGVGTLEQDKFMPHVEEFLKNKKYKLESLSVKKYARLQKLASRFLLYKVPVYRRGMDGQHHLYVPKKNRIYMMTTAHDHSGHIGYFSTRALLTQRFWWPEME